MKEMGVEGRDGCYWWKRWIPSKTNLYDINIHTKPLTFIGVIDSSMNFSCAISSSFEVFEMGNLIC